MFSSKQQDEATAPLLLEAHEEQLQPRAPAVSTSPFYNDAPRQRTNVGWAISYVVFCLLVAAAGIALFATGARDFLELADIKHLQDPASCPLDRAPLPHARRGLFGLGGDPHDDAGDVDVTFTQLMAHPISAVLGTLSGSLALGVLFVLGIRYKANAMILAAIALQVGVVVGLGAWLAVSHQAVASGILFAYAALLVWLFWLWREQIALVGRLLGITGHALADNPSLVVLGLTTPLVWALVFVAALALALGAVSNGHVAPNPSRGGRPASKGPDGHLQCLGGDDGTQTVLCCAWELETQAWVYLSVLGVALTWTSMLLGQVKLFATAGCVAQWYFIPAEPTLALEPATKPGSSSNSATSRRPRRRVLKSLRHALGPQFGSLCAASALLTVIDYLRQALDAAEQNATHENKLVAFVCVVLAALLRFVLSLVEFLTRFTTVRMAISGEPFMEAAHAAVGLFTRNAMDAFGVWWLPPFILGNCALLLSVLLGTATWATSSLLVYRTQDAHDGSAAAIGIIAFITGWAVLAFLSGLLQNVLDSVFMCFAMDRDMGRVTRQDVYVVLQELPSAHKQGTVVQQPDGGVAYGTTSV